MVYTPTFVEFEQSNKGPRLGCEKVYWLMVKISNSWNMKICLKTFLLEIAYTFGIGEFPGIIRKLCIV